MIVDRRPSLGHLPAPNNKMISLGNLPSEMAFYRLRWRATLEERFLWKINNLDCFISWPDLEGDSHDDGLYSLWEEFFRSQVIANSGMKRHKP